jgi:hypothetical protein
MTLLLTHKYKVTDYYVVPQTFARKCTLSKFGLPLLLEPQVVETIMNLFWENQMRPSGIVTHITVLSSILGYETMHRNFLNSA